MERSLKWPNTVRDFGYGIGPQNTRSVGIYFSNEELYKTLPMWRELNVSQSYGPTSKAKVPVFKPSNRQTASDESYLCAFCTGKQHVTSTSVVRSIMRNNVCPSTIAWLLPNPLTDSHEDEGILNESHTMCVNLSNGWSFIWTLLCNIRGKHSSPIQTVT